MVSELMPRGYDNMFFALFGITNRAVRTTRSYESGRIQQMNNIVTVFDHRPECSPSNHKRHSK